MQVNTTKVQRKKQGQLLDLRLNAYFTKQLPVIPALKHRMPPQKGVAREGTDCHENTAKHRVLWPYTRMNTLLQKYEQETETPEKRMAVTEALNDASERSEQTSRVRCERREMWQYKRIGPFKTIFLAYRLLPKTWALHTTYSNFRRCSLITVKRMPLFGVHTRRNVSIYDLARKRFFSRRITSLGTSISPPETASSLSGCAGIDFYKQNRQSVADCLF